MESPDYVGIDLHRRRSMLVRRDSKGDTVHALRVTNDDTTAITGMLAAAGEHPDVVVEATYGWYWLADLVTEAGAELHLAHPLGNNWGNRRVKNDRRDAEDLVDLLRLGRLAESWVAPPELRELRELVRYRAKLVGLAAGLKSQIHAVLAKEGVAVPMSDLFGTRGNRLLDECALGTAYRLRVDSLRGLIGDYGRQITTVALEIRSRLGHHQGYQAIQAIPRVGAVFAAIFVAEIGDVTRFDRPSQLCCWAGLTPRHRESDTKVHRGQITKQGSALVRWAAVEAVQRQDPDTPLGANFRRISASHGSGPDARKIARVAVARKLLTLVYFGLRDGEIRCLAS
jgi:transposase